MRAVFASDESDTWVDAGAGGPFEAELELPPNPPKKDIFCLAKASKPNAQMSTSVDFRIDQPQALL